MGDLRINLDVSGLNEFMENFSKELTRDLQKGVAGLARATHAHIVEDVQKNLHSFRDAYLEALSEPEQVDDVLWVITLDEKATWIEDGRPEFDMKPGLLKKGKDGKNGKYRIVPMNQAKTPTQLSSGNGGYEQNMINKVKSELKARGIPYKKLELDQNGSPRTGKLHSMNIDSYTPGKGNTPQLHGLNIYQTKQKDGSVKRSIATFRTVTEHGQEGKWIHPSVEAKEFMDKAVQWASDQWDQVWLPAILEKYGG